uniref:Photosystem I reaction center subunit VIII n=1 Tax=Calectasia narragara TaxID=1276544 RepID=M1JDR4_9LILI|nr:photosystem I subunit VIII [Calectasia narragara]
MTDFNLPLPSIFVPLVGLVLPAIAMAFFSFLVERNKIV